MAKSVRIERMTKRLRLARDGLLDSYDELITVGENSERSALIDDTITSISELLWVLCGEDFPGRTAHRDSMTWQN